MSWTIETGAGKAAYTTSETFARAWDAWKAWDAIVLEPDQKKRLSRNGRVIRRERALPTPKPTPVAQEALWT